MFRKDYFIDPSPLDDPNEEGPLQVDVRRLASDVLAIQNASNITAVIATWGRMQGAIRALAGDSRAAETHVLNVLMLSKVVSMMRVNADCLGGVTGQDAENENADLTGPQAWAKAEAMANGTLKE